MIRAFPWENTPLGPIPGWPAALKTLLATALVSAAPKLLLWGPDLITLHNDAYSTNLGTAFADAIGRPFPALRRDVWPKLGPHIEAAYSGSPQFLPNFRAITRRYGRDEPASGTLVYTPVPLEDGSIGGVLGEVYDTTREFERSDRLEGENARLSQMFERSPVLMAATSGPLLTFRDANPAFDRFFGGRPLIGCALADAIPEAAAQDMVAPLQAVFRTGEPWIGQEVEFCVGHGPGAASERRFVDFIWQATRDDHGAITGLVFFGYDVTSRRVSRERADHLHAQLLHASRLNAMGTMAMTLAHELNQPLTAAANFLTAGQRFLVKGGDQRAIENLLRESEQQIQRAGEIIRRMRSLVSAGAAHREEVPLTEVIGRVVRLLETSGELSRNRVEIAVAARAETVIADQVQLEQILLNLLRNAGQASSAITEPIIVDAIAAGALVQVSVQDRGAGIAAERIGGLFDALQPSTSGGLGVGLSLCRTMVEAQGGRIWAEGPAAGGTIVNFTLPAGPQQRATD